MMDVRRSAPQARDLGGGDEDDERSRWRARRPEGFGALALGSAVYLAAVCTGLSSLDNMTVHAVFVSMYALTVHAVDVSI
jgi:hypothetical protein